MSILISGRIISIYYEHDAAIAKAEFIILNWRNFNGLFLIIKIGGFLDNNA